ncbi:hypothetical protein CDAR_45081 [Caerostris darwini]|uniref:Uncharacterized protein n=1 Tax=Caerostris darwini TaxID=1538125 RepID=A0AAV4UYI5_9ARAC|nr:hypothetical protein CDAR_45081 [Caerostris darwini]
MCLPDDTTSQTSYPWPNHPEWVSFKKGLFFTFLTSFPCDPIYFGCYRNVKSMLKEQESSRKDVVIAGANKREENSRSDGMPICLPDDTTSQTSYPWPNHPEWVSFKKGLFFTFLTSFPCDPIYFGCYRNVKSMLKEQESSRKDVVIAGANKREEKSRSDEMPVSLQR